MITTFAVGEETFQLDGKPFQLPRAGNRPGRIRDYRFYVSEGLFAGLTGGTPDDSEGDVS